MSRFDVSGVELSLHQSPIPHKCWSNRDGLSKQAESLGKNGAVASKVLQDTRGFLGSGRRLSTIIDVTHSGTAIYMGGAVAIGEDCVPGVTYVNVILWQISRNSG